MKSFKMFLLSLSAAALLLGSIPAPAAYAAGSGESKIVVKNVKDVDKKLVNKAKEALKPYITGDIEFETASYNTVVGGKKAPTLRTKESRTATDPQKIWAAEVTIVEETGEIDMILLDAQFPSVNDSVRNKVKAAIKETGRNLDYKDIPIFRIDPSLGELYTFGGPFSLEIDYESGKLLYAEYRLKLSEVDPKAVQAAQQAAIALTGEKKIKFDYIVRQESDYRNIYSFNTQNQSLDIWVGAETNEVERAWWHGGSPKLRNAEEKEKLKKPMYTNEEAITAMNPLMKKLFGVDLTGYQVKVDEDWYTFSKKGSPNISAQINLEGKVYQVIRSKATK
ncbi:hypothetical protein NDS46_05560 [Paenibacillus thiaminolyticus]|uniref:hypothetical protein n=1 Tax=Paenibacillus thiaminolyticus TaxID=49283 RepID=UPI00233080FF|nr:hypothetical protein [Paenibacillus thiaminolyticus]WCF09365.1 hypothetical protein NDS46_05560 [Paenibacillus thiaminolyticus]